MIQNENIEFDSTSVNGISMTVNLEKKREELQPLIRLFQKPVVDVYKTIEFKNLMDQMKDLSGNLVNYAEEFDITSILDNDRAIKFYNGYINQISSHVALLSKNPRLRPFVNFFKFQMVIWNSTDRYESLCIRLVKFDCHLLLIRLLGKLIEVVNEKVLSEDEKLSILVLSCLGILHNINSKLNYTRGQFRNERLVEYLMPLVKLNSCRAEDSNNQIRTAALLLMAFLVTENENSIINATDDHLVYLAGIFRHCLDADNLYSHTDGYHCLEILHGLKHLSAPDCNKRRLVANGILSLITRLLTSYTTHRTHHKEMVACLELLWSLTFSRDCLLALDNDHCQLRKLVEQISAEDMTVDILLAARGVIWNLQNSLQQHPQLAAAQLSVPSSSNSFDDSSSSGLTGGLLTPHTADIASQVNSFNSLIRKESSVSPNVQGHIMISYQHSTQAIMVEIKEKLVVSGYKVWMDVDHMTGSFVDAMAEGIQHASVLILGLCQAFKNSPHCRQEVKYAYTLGIPLVPIMLEQGFVADGWLGLMCATLIYTEFFNVQQFDSQFTHLLKEIGDRGRQSTVNNGSSSMDNCNLMCCKSTKTVPAVNSQLIEAEDNGFDILASSIRSNHSAPIIAKEGPPSPCPPQYLFSLDSYTSDHSNSIISLQTNSNLIHLTKSQLVQWTPRQVSDWLMDNYQIKLTNQIADRLSGELLVEWAAIRLDAPQAFFRQLETCPGLNLDFISILNLSRALHMIGQLNNR